MLSLTFSFIVFKTDKDHLVVLRLTNLSILQPCTLISDINVKTMPLVVRPQDAKAAKGTTDHPGSRDFDHRWEADDAVKRNVGMKIAEFVSYKPSAETKS